MAMVDLRLDSVSKYYRIRSAVQTKGFTSKFVRTQKKQFCAVRNVSFEVNRGESLGIIGHNGAGKSTILKLLSGITSPSEGEIFINGRLSALLEVGSGFHPELTGRENTYLSGSILGMRRSDITAQLDSIVDFAGVRQFLDIPVKQYSSGMAVRLGFSIAAHLNPDILLLDEVLAVGDRAFQEKCHERISELHRQGITLVFISHDLTAVRRLCQRVILLQRGEIAGNGDPEEMIRQYTETAAFHQHSRADAELRSAEIIEVAFFNQKGVRTSSFRTGEGVKVRVKYVAHEEIAKASISLFFYSSDSSLIAQWSTSTDGELFAMRAGQGTIEFSCGALGLQAGVYQIDSTIERGEARNEIEWQQGCVSIHVESSKHLRGGIYMPHEWRQLRSVTELD